MRQFSKYLSGFLLLAITLLIGCNDPPWEVDTAINATTNNNLTTFSFSGNGYPILFSVWAHRNDSSDFLWQLVPNDSQNLKQAYKLAPIIYGQVPSGWKQIIPKNGEVPILQEGHKYGVSSLSNGANTRITIFTIEKGRVKILNES
jgi:hypothetical protein